MEEGINTFVRGPKPEESTEVSEDTKESEDSSEEE